MDFADLEARSRTIAGALAARGLRGERVLILHGSSPELVATFLACQIAGAIPVVTPRPRPARSGA